MATEVMIFVWMACGGDLCCEEDGGKKVCMVEVV